MIMIKCLLGMVIKIKKKFFRYKKEELIMMTKMKMENRKIRIGRKLRYTTMNSYSIGLEALVRYRLFYAFLFISPRYLIQTNFL